MRMLVAELQFPRLYLIILSPIRSVAELLREDLVNRAEFRREDCAESSGI